MHASTRHCCKLSEALGVSRCISSLADTMTLNFTKVGVKREMHYPRRRSTDLIISWILLNLGHASFKHFRIPRSNARSSQYCYNTAPAALPRLASAHELASLRPQLMSDDLCERKHSRKN